MFVAASVGLLIERGTRLPSGALLDWDTKVSAVLGADWALQDEYASAHADLTDLLGMRSGLPSHDLWYAGGPPLETVRRLRDLPLTAELRQAFQYNNLHYVTLSHVVSVLSGRPFPDFVREHIFAPLDMRDTTYSSSAAGATGRRSAAYHHTGVNMSACVGAGGGPGSAACRGERVNLGWWLAGDGLNNAGPGGVLTSLWDMSAWQGEFLRPAQTALTPALVAKLADPVIPMGRQRQSGPEPELSAPLYGRGQMSHAYRGEGVVWHTGGLPGQISMVWHLPARGLSVAVFTNDQNYGALFMHAAARAIVDDALRLPRIDWRTRFWARMQAAYAPPPAPRPGAAPPLEGRFAHIAYGTWNVSRLAGADGDAVLPFLPEGVARENASATALHGVFADRLVFTPFAGAVYNWTALRYDPPMVMGSGSAVATDSGLGMFGRFSTPGDVKLHAPSEDPGDAEVWLARV